MTAREQVIEVIAAATPYPSRRGLEKIVDALAASPVLIPWLVEAGVLEPVQWLEGGPTEPSTINAFYGDPVYREV